MRMIPDFIPESAPPGEIDVFRKLSSSNQNWTVIHSLDLAPYNSSRRTEIDFVVLIPDSGILCIEVKSHRELGFDGARWYPESITRSPFEQALNARFALHRRLVDRLAQFAGVPVLHCCVFPRADFPVPSNVSIRPFEVLDRGGFLACATGDDFCDALRRMMRRAITEDPQLTPLKTPISAQAEAEFLKFCFPIRMRRPERQDELLQREEELAAVLRDQQRPVLGLTQYNPRVVVEGGAGTGKSLIGIEVARRRAARGERVGYLCFNRLIGGWAERELADDQSPRLTGGSALSVLMRLTGIKAPENPGRQFWTELPLLIQDKLTDPGYLQDVQFDYLVIDEAQDILARPDLLDCISLLIKGGLSEGNFLMLGDFLNQVMTGEEAVRRALAKIKAASACWALTENCRNYRPIGQIAITLSSANSGTYTGYLRQGGGKDSWDIRTYSDETEQSIQIEGCISHALQAGFRDEDITLLSFGAEEVSILSRVKESSGRRFVPAGQAPGGGIRWSTVSAFKGLESKVIIITDIAVSDMNFDRNRFYTGITRATERLYLFCHRESGPMLADWVTKSRLPEGDKKDEQGKIG